MKASVVIPTKNGEEYLDEVLAAVFGQQAPFDFEVVIVDSGSTDRTLEIIGRYPAVKLHRIPPLEFNHGETRNFAIRQARPLLGTGRKHVELVWKVADLDDFIEHLGECGVTVEERQETPDGDFVFLSDPEGNRVALCQETNGA